MNTNELTLPDIKFLQAVSEINKQPNNYQDTDKGELPANSKSIRKSTDLNSNQVSYRMGGNSSSRGFAEGDNPLIISHEPVRNDNGFGPRSAELTENGREMLGTAQNQINEISGIKRQEFKQLRQDVDAINNLFSSVLGVSPSKEYADEEERRYVGHFMMYRLQKLDEEWEY